MHKDLNSHLENHQCSHLMLAFSRLQEHQNVIVSLNTKVIHLESVVESQQKHISALESSIAAGAAALVALEVRQNRAMQDAIYNVEQQNERRHSEAASQMRSVQQGLLRQQQQQQHGTTR